MHVFSQNTVNTSVFEKAFQKHCKIQHFCQSVANSGVLATLAFLAVAKISFDSILGLAEEKTSQIALLCSW